jgi:F-box protein 11
VAAMVAFLYIMRVCLCLFILSHVIQIYDNVFPLTGQGVIEDNEVFENALAGVWIKKESTPTLKRNKIHHGYECGICVFENGQGHIEDNDIFCNGTIGVLINSGSKPTLKANRIYSCGTFGIEVINESGGVIENNMVFDNQYEGIALATGVHSQLKDNMVFNNHNLLEKTLAAGLCLFNVSGDRSFPMHDYYRCLTCVTSANNAICYTCIRNCHQGHETEFVRHDRFYCDCGAGLLTSQCLITAAGSEQQEITPLSDENEEV